MIIVNASKLVEHGQVAQSYPYAWLFRSFLHGRKPSLILAYEYLMEEGNILAIQQELLPQPSPLEQFRMQRQAVRGESIREYLKA